MKRDTLVTLSVMIASVSYMVMALILIDIENRKPKPLIPYKLNANKFTDPVIEGINNLPEKPILVPDSLDWYNYTWMPMLEHVLLPTVEMVLTDAGKYYVTNYCPAECGGSWATSSGATCHRASYEDRLTEPTTCAIDLSVNSYGDLFYIPAFDRVFIAEDTGSGVKGKWLDLFYVDYADVVNFPVGWYQVYNVEYVYGYKQACYYDIRPLFNTKFKEIFQH